MRFYTGQPSSKYTVLKLINISKVKISKGIKKRIKWFYKEFSKLNVIGIKMNKKSKLRI